LSIDYRDTSVFSTADVRRYYDANTAAFVRRGQGGSLGAIHRAVWGPGVTDRGTAFRYVENLLLRRLDATPADRTPHVLDLGCGVGGSLTYLAQQRSLRATGVTLSPVQARLGQQRVAETGIANRVEILEGDYTNLPAGIGDIDLAYAIEAFVHGPSPESFFVEARRVLVSGGLLIVCDDFRTDGGDPAAARTLAQFAHGWHVNTLLAPAALRDLAARAGFDLVETIDLTPFLELARPRDRVIALLTSTLGWIPPLGRRFAPLVGGAALQRGLARGWIAYHCVVFRRR
jgi:tocopherol O-methyltransferase